MDQGSNPSPVVEAVPGEEIGVAELPPVIDCPLVERPAPAPRPPEPIETLAGDLRAQVQALGEELRRAQAIVLRLLDGEEEKAQERRTREALFEKLDASRPQFQLQFIRPLVIRMAGLFDLVKEWTRQPPPDAAGFASCMELLARQFREVMELHGVEMVAPKADDAFDRRFHHVVATQATGESALHEHVAGLLQHGFIFFGQNANNGALTPVVIRPARVTTWKFDPSLVPAVAGAGEGEPGEQPPPRGATNEVHE